MKKLNARPTLRRTAMSLAVGMCLAGVVHAQAIEGSINGTAKAGATVTLTAPGGATSQIKAGPDGAFSFSKVAPGTYKVTSDGVTRDVVVAGGGQARVDLGGGTTMEAITVTGSRIARDTFTSTSPVLVVTRDETMMSGFNSTTEALQGTAVTGGGSQINNAFGGFVTDGGPGANTISLRGLGATRTLVLLNGRRLAPAGSRGSVGSADLNVLPTSVIDRIEVLKDGASSIYGSDAIAGVINVITKKNLEGITLEAQYNYPENGGGQEARAAATYGWVGNKGFFSGTVEVYDRKELTLGDRDWTKCQTDYVRKRNADGTMGPWGSGDFIDPRTGQPKCYTLSGTGANGLTVNTLGSGTFAGVGAPGSVGTTFNRWRPNASVATGLPGYEGVGGGSNSINLRDTFDPRMLDQSLISPARVYNGFFQGGFDTGILGNAEAYFEGLFTRRESSQTGFRQLILDYTRGNPLIPTELRSVPVNLQPGATAVAPGPIQYRAFIGSPYENEQTVDYFKVLAGLRGNLPWSDWKYDGVVSLAKSDASYGTELFLTDRVANSLNAVQNADGSFSCRTAAGCVPAPRLTPALLGGAVPQDYLDYVRSNVVGKTKYDETTFTVNATGSLFELPHGTARGAVGVEYRKAKIDDTPSEDSQNGNLYNFSSSAVTRGSDSVWELYGEVELPLLRSLPGAEELTVNLSARYTDYQSYGGETTYKVGALWSPVRAVSFRGAIGTSYRAPALFEQFVGATTGFLSSTNDPCNNYGGLDQTTNRARNCASEGLSPNFQATSSVASVTIGGKDAGLEAETSKNKTFGVILQPQLGKEWGDFSFAVDYFDIRVDNGVDRIGTGNILGLCYASANFSSPYCPLISRSAPGTNRALTVNNSYVNVSSDQVKGFDYTIRYARDIGPGKFRASGVITHYTTQENKLFPDDPYLSYNGIIGYPKTTGVFDFSYQWQAWRFRYGLDWIGKMDSYAYDEEDPATSIFKLETASYMRHGVSVEYKASKWSVIGGVRNMFDKEPPQISYGFNNRVGNAPLYSGFDYVGRTWFLSGIYSF